MKYRLKLMVTLERVRIHYRAYKEKKTRRRIIIRQTVDSLAEGHEFVYGTNNIRDAVLAREVLNELGLQVELFEGSIFKYSFRLIKP